MLAPFITAIALTAAITIVVMHWARQRAQRQVEQRLEQYRVLQAQSLRVFWQVSADFDASGWARSDMDRLRLLCRNIDARRPLTERLCDRLKRSASAVVAGVIDRLEDISRTGRDLELSEGHLGRINASCAALVDELSGVEFRVGSVPHFQPQRVARAIDRALVACDALRSAVAPRIAADIEPLLYWLMSSRFPRSLDAGRLSVEASGVTDGGRVAVRAADLLAALEELLARTLHHNQLEGTVHITMRQDRERLHLQLDCRVLDRWRLSPSSLVEPLRMLAAYDVRVALEEELEDSLIRIALALPRDRQLADNVATFERAV